jgi:hypothetical protein
LNDLFLYDIIIINIPHKVLLKVIKEVLMNVEANKLSVYITEESFELDYITDKNLNDEESSVEIIYNLVGAIDLPDFADLLDEEN